MRRTMLTALSVFAAVAMAPAYAAEPSRTDVIVGLAVTCAQSPDLDAIAGRAERFGWTGIAAADAKRLEATGGNDPSLRGWTLGEDGGHYLLVQKSGGGVQCELLYKDGDADAVQAALSKKGLLGKGLGPARRGAMIRGRSDLTWTATAPAGWSSVTFSPSPPSGPDAWKHSRIIFKSGG